MVWWFDVPKIAFGEEALNDLEVVPESRVVIITDNVINGLGFPDRVKEILENAGKSVTIWEGAEPDPRVSIVKQAAEALAKAEADLIVALGGGSVMDTAKAAWVLYENPDVELEALNPFDQLGLRQKARLVCIPTTAGTGSEATRAIVIREDKTGRKFATINPELVPDLAILDPELVKGLPKALTAYTGLDALTHAVEAFISVWKNDFSDACSIQAVRMVFQWLPKSVTNPEDIKAREKMMIAASLAGMAFSNSQVCLAHSLGHSLGSVLRMHHGLAVGIALPYTIEYNSHNNQETAKHYAELSKLVGITEENAERAAKTFAEKIRELQRKVEFPTSIRDAGISEKDFREGLDTLVEYAMMDSSITMTPRDIDADGIRRIYECMYDGTSVDF